MPLPLSMKSFCASSPKPKDSFTQPLVGSIWLTCRSTIAKFVLIGNPIRPLFELLNRKATRLETWREVSRWLVDLKLLKSFWSEIQDGRPSSNETLWYSKPIDPHVYQSSPTSNFALNTLLYHVLTKYSDNLRIYRTCSKMWTCRFFYLFICLKLLDEEQRV